MWKPIKPPFRKFKKSVVFKNISEISEFIYQLGESQILLGSSIEVPIKKIKSKEYQIKFTYLKKCLLKYRKITGMGRGITAVQVGIPERFSVIYIPSNKELKIIINPKITKSSKEKLKYPEICMSASPVIVPTIRPAWVEFKYYDENGKLQNWTEKDDTDDGRILNRVFQHEFDHMDGIINLHKVGNPKELILQSDPKFYDTAKFEEVA